MEPAESMAILASQYYDYVRFTFTDINGVSRCKLVKKHCLKRYFDEGITLYEALVGVCLRGEIFPDKLIDERPLFHGNVAALPQLGTLHPLPAASTDHIKLGEVFCETKFMYDGTMQTSCPRYAAREILKKLEDSGYRSYASYELEWLLLHDDQKPVFENPGQVFHGPSMANFADILFQIDQNLEKMGVLLDTLQTEYAPGQIEFATTPQVGIMAADHAIMIKDCIREVANRTSHKAVFMTKTYKNIIASSALHLNISLKDKKGENVFYDASDENNLSAVFYQWMAGLIKHARALTAFCCPTVNCYRRMHHPSAWTPCYATWGIDCRLASFRVKNHSRQSTYMECRLPSSAANPYLVLAAVVAAGMDGIDNQLHCPPQATYTNNVPDGSHPEFPHTLAEALDALENDAYMKQALGPKLVKWFNVVKKFELEDLKCSDVTNDDDSEENFAKERDMYMRLI